MAITLTPLATTNAGGTFNLNVIGSVAGTVYPSASARYFWETGFIAASVTGLIYPGVGVTVTTKSAAAPMLGPQLTIATSISNLHGFAIWEQSAAGIQTPQSNVPLFSPGMSITFIEFGLGNVIWLPMSNANAANLLSVVDSTQLSWDYTNQVLLPYTSGQIPGPSTLPAKIIDIQIGNSWVVTPNSPSTGLATWNQTGSTVAIQI